MPIKRENIDAPMSRFVNPDTGVLTLHHYTPHINGDVDTFATDPKHFGRNPWSKAEVEADPSPKTFFYVDPEDREDNWFGDRTPHFTAEYDPAKVYDASVDRKRIVSRLRHIGRIIAVLKRLGYHGMYYSGSFPTVAMWKPVEVKRVKEPDAKLARMTAPAGGAIVNNTFLPGGSFLPRAFHRIRTVVAKARAKKMARKPADPLPGSNIVPLDTFKQPTLTLHQLKSVEDTFGVPDHERLSNAPSLKVSADGRIESDANDRWTFLDNLTRRRMGGHPIGKKILDGSVDPGEKLVYLTHHLAHDAALHQNNGAKEWYGSHLDVLDAALHKLYGWKPGSAGNTLAKAVIALTSGNQNPRDNTSAALRMLDHGKARSGGATDHRLFAAIPKANFPALSEWLAKAALLHPDKQAHELEGVGSDPVAYWRRIVAPFQEELTPKGGGSRQAGFKGVKIAVDKATNEPIGAIEGYGHKQQLVSFADGKPLKWDAATMKDGLMPVPARETGRLLPKGWSNRGAQVASGLDAVQKLVAAKGMKGAAEWLMTEHRKGEFKELFGRAPEDAFSVYGEEKLPGSFVLGPKFGTFMLNLHANKQPEHGKYLTADLWWSRQWNLYLASLFAAVNGKREPVKAPTSVAERRVMFKVAKDAAKRAGLDSVAQLQAVLWYYTQNLSRLFGGATPSYSFVDGVRTRFPNAGIDAKGRVKLARRDESQLTESVLWRISQLADRMALSGRIPAPQLLIDALVAAMKAAGEPVVKLSREHREQLVQRYVETGDDTPRKMAADMLEDDSDGRDPRAEILRHGTREQGIFSQLPSWVPGLTQLAHPVLHTTSTAVAWPDHTDPKNRMLLGVGAYQARSHKFQSDPNGQKFVAVHLLPLGPDGIPHWNRKLIRLFTLEKFKTWLRAFPPELKDSAYDIARTAHAHLTGRPAKAPYRGLPNRERLARQKRDGLSFVSSSTRPDSKLPEAIAGLASPEFRKLEAETPGGKSGLGFWEDGAEESRIVPSGDPEHAERIGRAFGQRATLSFRFDPSGPHVLHVLHVNRADPATIHETLKEQGAPYATIVPDGERLDRSTVFVTDRDGTAADPVRAAARILDARHRTVKGEAVLRTLKEKLSRRLAVRDETARLVYQPGILADQFADVGDPREEIVRNGHFTRGWGNTINGISLMRTSDEAARKIGTRLIRVRNTGPGLGRFSQGEVDMGDGTAIRVEHVHPALSQAAQEERAKNPGPVNHAFILSIVPTDRLRDDPAFPDTFSHAKSYTVRELADWLKTFPEESKDKAHAIARIAAQAIKWYNGERGRIESNRTRLARPAEYKVPAGRPVAIPGTATGVNHPRKIGRYFVKRVAEAGSPYAEEAAQRLREHLGLPTLRMKRATDGKGREWMFGPHEEGLSTIDNYEAKGNTPVHPSEAGHVVNNLLADYLTADDDRHGANYVDHPVHGWMSIDHGEAFHPLNRKWSARDDAEAWQEAVKHLSTHTPLGTGPEYASYPEYQETYRDQLRRRAIPDLADSYLWQVSPNAVKTATASPGVVAKAISPAHERHLMKLAWEGTEDLPREERLAAVRAMRHRIRHLRETVRANGTGTLTGAQLVETADRARASYKPDTGVS